MMMLLREASGSTSRASQGSRHAGGVRVPVASHRFSNHTFYSLPGLEEGSQRRLMTAAARIQVHDTSRTAGTTRCIAEVSGETSTSSEEAQHFFHEAAVPSGRIDIRAVAAADVTGVSVVMTRAFATTDEDIHLNSAIEYVNGIINQGAKGSLLVARLFPTDSTLLPPNQDSRIVGLVALAFHPDTMQPCPSLPPPPGAAYLSNMAVDVKLRRQGIARALLAAAARVAASAGQAALYLHVKQSDEAAQKLYATSGYMEVARDSMMVKFKGIKPRILMRKLL